MVVLSPLVQLDNQLSQLAKMVVLSARPTAHLALSVPPLGNPQRCLGAPLGPKSLSALAAKKNNTEGDDQRREHQMLKTKSLDVMDQVLWTKYYGPNAMDHG